MHPIGFGAQRKDLLSSGTNFRVAQPAPNYLREYARSTLYVVYTP